MYLVEKENGKKHIVSIETLTIGEFAKIKKSRYAFEWKTEKKNEVYKICLKGSGDILGLISLTQSEDPRIEINLLAVSKENVGENKVYERIAGNLIAWACREAVKRFGEDACVSLIPKTNLVDHYKEMYGMMAAGVSLFLSDGPLLKILDRYDK